MRCAVVLLVVALPAAAQRPLTAFQRDKAATIVREQLPCLGCHELNGEGGRTAPSLTTVGERRDAAYIRAMIEDPQRVVPGAAMPKTPMPAPVRELVIRYVSANAVTLPPSTKPPSPPARVARQATAAENYARFCASCHGVSGQGSGPNAKYLPAKPAIHSSAARMSARSDDALFDAISGGGLVMGRSARMPAFGATLSPSEIRALVGYIRTLCACKGPAWSVDPVPRATRP